MKKRICRPCYIFSICMLVYSFIAPGISAAPADAIHNVMTGDQTNYGMIIGISIAGGIAALAIIITIILAIASKKKKDKDYKPKH